MIVPTNGRVMLYQPIRSGDRRDEGIVQRDETVLLMAQVCHVWNENLVSLDVVDSVGRHHFRERVPVVQDGSPYSGDDPYTFHAEWMPCQKGQAAKAEALEAKAVA